MKAALAGIAVAWAIIFVMAVISWLVTNHPEIASWIAFAVVVALTGAVVGWSFTS